MSNPKTERVFQSWRIAIRNRLLSIPAMDPETADRWCNDWEAGAARQGLARDGDY